MITSALKRVRHYLTNTSWILTEKVISMAAGFFLAILLARYLGPEQYGIFSYGLAIVTLFAVVGHAGMNGLVVRELVSSQRPTTETLGTTFGMKTLGYIIAFIGVIAFFIGTEEIGSLEFWVLSTLALTIIFRPFAIIDFWFQSQLQAKYSAYVRLSALLFATLLKILLIFSGASLLCFAAANVVQAFLTAVFFILVYYFKSNVSIKSWFFSGERAKTLLKESSLVFLGSIFAVIYLKIDQVMLRWLAGAEEVGVYAVAASLSEAWYFIPMAIVSSFFPRLINLRKTNEELFKKRLQQLFDMLFMIAIGVALLVTVLADPMINLLFGSEYNEASSILVIHIWAALFIFMRAALSKWILIEKVYVFSLVSQGTGAVLNVALNILLIPLWGGVGAALATLFSYMAASYLALVIYPRSRPIFWMMTRAIISPARYLPNLVRLSK